MHTLDNTTLKDIKHDDLVINKMENDCLKGHINMRMMVISYYQYHMMKALILPWMVKR